MFCAVQLCPNLHCVRLVMAYASPVDDEALEVLYFSGGPMFCVVFVADYGQMK